ncbi:hypothetical protein MI170_20890 [Mycolicibacterium goodii]|uniref:hypothetical protein n=1 Tax=Mycolicibacterium goodii TaxID=134601 RepID=UPI001BDCCB3C|nr:hypothetical protein [Mycolicibacterium goodii]MBU8814998.1 hypothetical protein [Mycolicibacterium goodii]ULN45779.1 hypothetical protein MI170_20890 [Mycolicibacterium goodii]
MSLPPPNPPPQGPQYWQQPPHWQQWPSPQWPPGGFPPPKKSRTPKLAIGILAAVGMLFVTAVGFVFYAATTNGPVTATSYVSFRHVCEGDWVKNAADYGEPYQVVAFYYGLGYNGDEWMSVGSGKWTGADPTQGFTQINAVACLTRKEGTAIKTATCEDEDAGARIEIDYLSVDYDSELREAKTGKVVRNLGVVKGIADRCPGFGYYKRGSKKIYARPDEKAVTRMLEKFAG